MFLPQLIKTLKHISLDSEKSPEKSKSDLLKENDLPDTVELKKMIGFSPKGMEEVDEYARLIHICLNQARVHRGFVIDENAASLNSKSDFIKHD